MTNMISFFRKSLAIGLMFFAFIGCQDMERPPLGDYPVDENPPGGPLKFFVNFDAESTNPLMIAVDNIRANFPQDNPLSTIEGTTGNAVQGVAGKYIPYAKPNDFASTAKSFSIAFWEKHDDTMTGDNGEGGTQHVFGMSSSNGHWTRAAMFLLFDGGSNNTTGSILKLFVAGKNADGSISEKWFEFVGDNRVPGLQDNQWHHLAFVYDATTSEMILYKDGVKFPTTAPILWKDGDVLHGDVNFDNSKVTGFKINGGPQTPGETGDSWLQNAWKGGLDQFRLYGTALTAQEVMSLYTNKE